MLEDMLFSILFWFAFMIIGLVLIDVFSPKKNKDREP